MGNNSKFEKLADTIVNYSLELSKDENVLIMCEGFPAVPLVKVLIRKIGEVGANAFVKFSDTSVLKLLMDYTYDSKLKVLEEIEQFEVDHYSAFIKIRCNNNDYELSDVSPEIIKKRNKAVEKQRDIRTNERKWVLLNYPTNVDAYKAGVDTDSFFDYAMDVMCYDYESMDVGLKPLKELMEKTDKVRLTGVDTDITFSIKDMPIIPCTGKMNIPDGEIYCAPVKDSVNGVIHYNTPSPYQGNVYTGVRLEFKDGKIVDATCDDSSMNERLNEIFDTDLGARYVGEFSIGVNPLVKEPIGDILFDEKIIGSIHFTPGMAYKDSFNGNTSTVHWDMVLIQRKEYGGGDIYFDDVLIRKDGIFVLPELLHLNK